jgi:hypothetical protein
MSQIKPITATSEPTICVPSDRPIPPQSLGGATETILAVAVLVRSIALLIQVLAPIVRKSGK